MHSARSLAPHLAVASPRARAPRSAGAAMRLSGASREIALRPGPGRIPQEVDEKAEQREDKDHDDPQSLAARAEIVPPKNTNSDERPDSDPGDQADGGDEHGDGAYKPESRLDEPARRRHAPDKHGPDLGEALAPLPIQVVVDPDGYLPKNARWSWRACEDESQGFSSRSTITSATCSCSGGSEGGCGFQFRRARTFAWILALERVSSSASLCSSRTCSSSVRNCASSTGTARITSRRTRYLPRRANAHVPLPERGLGTRDEGSPRPAPAAAPLPLPLGARNGQPAWPQQRATPDFWEARRVSSAIDVDRPRLVRGGQAPRLQARACREVPRLRRARLARGTAGWTAPETPGSSET